jgi:DNA modification methylase
MNIQEIEIDKLIPYHNNPRKDQAVDKVASSINEYGFQQPIVVDKNMVVIVGHTRLLGAKKLGLSKVPVYIADLSESKAKAYRIADNRLNEDSNWDFNLLDLEIKNLLDDDYDIDLLGFDSSELDKFLTNDEEYLTDEDEVPEPPEEPIAKLGDIYQLGEHRLMCGDSTSIDAIDELMENQKADMVFTDPPYNINFQGTMGCTSKNGKIISMKDGYSVPNSQYEDIKNDKKNAEEFKEFITNIISIISMKCIGGWYICFASTSLNEILTPLIENEMKWKSIIIWNKNQSPMGGGHFRKKYEPIIYGYFNNLFYGQEYSEDDVWDIKRTVKNDLHPTMKPIELVEKAVLYSSKIKNTVLDLFGGSGSTLIACEKTNRKARLMELDPKYVDVIVQRWQDFTGKEAKRIN